MGSGNKIKVDGIMELSQAITYLEDILASLKEGVFRLEAGGDSLTLCPEKVVEFEMSVSQKKDKEKFELEISWKKDEKAFPATQVKIGA